jgi:predicted ribosome quality control (RQC) complex YloA/Tae2 family protein
MPGRLPYRRLEVDGFVVLVGRADADNDALTFGVAEPRDLWLHVAGCPGSHVVVRNPEGGDPPPAVLQRAAQLAAWHSKARGAKGKVPVHLCRVADVSKPRGAPPGEVRLSSFRELRVYARPG